ncbi:MAG: GFA family protein [Proteobacteria bacterium]|nr:GFA family protein [Pseudomonadota bacterium]
MADSPRAADSASREHAGACHCGAVRFTVMTPPEIIVEDCNCSICRKAGYLHLLVPAARFTLLTAHDALTTYCFNSGVARHTFCRYCGVKAFYVPRSNPDGYSVNLRCLDPRGLESVTVAAFDGQHWEQHAARLAARSRL